MKEKNVEIISFYASDIVLEADKLKPSRFFNVQFKACVDMEQSLSKEKNKENEQKLFEEIGLAIQEVCKKNNFDYTKKFDIKFEESSLNKFGWCKLKQQLNEK